MIELLQKIVLGLALLVGVFLGGYMYGQSEVTQTVTEKIVYKEGEVKTVYRDRIVTVTKEVKPDGTVTETTTTKETDKTTEKKKKETDIATAPVLPRYSLGVFAASPVDAFHPSEVQYGGSAGVRLIGPLWGRGTYLPSRKEVTLGFEIQF